MQRTAESKYQYRNWHHSMSPYRVLKEHQDWSEKGNGLQPFEIFMLQVCTQLLISKYASVMWLGSKSWEARSEMFHNSTAFPGNWSCGELSKWREICLWGMAGNKSRGALQLLCEEHKKVVRLSPERRRTTEELHPAKIYVNHELKGKATSPSQVSSAFLCWCIYLHM